MIFYFYWSISPQNKSNKSNLFKMHPDIPPKGNLDDWKHVALNHDCKGIIIWEFLTGTLWHTFDVVGNVHYAFGPVF